MNNSFYTIGFAQKSLEQFSNHLLTSNITKLVDTRLNNTSQLSGYAKRDDLKFVMKLLGIQYQHVIDLAPTQEMLEDYKKKRISWDEYENRYVDLIDQRKVVNFIDDIVGGERPCFLCSEHKPHNCHRRLLVEYLNQNGKPVNIVHLY